MRWMAGAPAAGCLRETLNQLELSDDAALATWGGSWRMPTMAELKELSDNCNYTWEKVNGVNGGMFTSRLNGRSIFLTATGWRHNGDSLFDRNVAGYFWSSSLDESSPYDAHYLGFSTGGTDASRVDRYYGLSVRPVLRN